MQDVVICSFFTDDDYYRGQADILRADLERLEIPYVLDEIHKEEGQDWADLCRRKVPFLLSVCEKYPDHRVFWIDVDCRLLSLPDFLRSSTADIVGFQRGFGSPMTIGYGRRTRFWEPCFWGVAPTPQARKMISDAAELEAASTIKATDDYFFEEGWRANADRLTFQVIPSICMVGREDPSSGRDPFFLFGSSGSVAEFKGKVTQHTEVGQAAGGSGRRRLVRAGKRAVDQLPERQRRRFIALADRTGLTRSLVGGSELSGSKSKPRRALSEGILRDGLAGDLDALEAGVAELTNRFLPNATERANIDAARSFGYYSGRASSESVLGMWWPRPFPGNFGDWLAPMVLGAHTDAQVRFLSPNDPTRDPHIVSIGSIGRFIKSCSIVVGTGVSSDEFSLHSKADYVSVRGPLTAAHLVSCGGPTVDTFGDPGALISRIIPVRREATNGRTAFVRHHAHRRVPVLLPDGYDELPVRMSHPDDIRKFVETLATYDVVLTSAMHVLIACQSYGIPCALVTFDGAEDAVHGSGIKYEDYARGVRVTPINPVVVNPDLNLLTLEPLVTCEVISEDKLDEIEASVREALRRYRARR